MTVPPERSEQIDRILGRLRVVWARYPQYRLGQLLSNATYAGPGRDWFYIEDDEVDIALGRLSRGAPFPHVPALDPVLGDVQRAWARVCHAWAGYVATGDARVLGDLREALVALDASLGGARSDPAAERVLGKGCSS